MPKAVPMMRQYELVDRVKRYNPSTDEDLLDRAYVYAMQKHGAQKRASGDLYFTHPLEVAAILTDLKLDDATIVAAVLHDTIEDTSATKEEIDRLFGPEIGHLVDGLTKIKKLDLVSKKAVQGENFRKLLLAISTDIRVLLVKLADRLHNMRTLHFIADDAKRRRIAKETMDIYAPLAERIGMYEFMNEMQTLAFRELEPDAHASIAKRLEQLHDGGGDRSATVEAERHQDVGGLRGRRSAIAQQLVGSERRPALERPRYGEHLDPTFGSFTGSDQAAAAFATLDDHEHLDQCSEDAVSQREPERIGFGARRPLGDQCPSFGDELPESCVLGGIGAIGSGADHRHRMRPVDSERATVGGTIDALRQPRNDHHPFRSEFVAEPGSGLSAALSGVAGADDADAARIEHPEVTAHEQRRRPTRIVEQHRWVGIVARHDHLHSSCHALLPHLVGRALHPGSLPRRREIGFTPEQRGEGLRRRTGARGDGKCLLGRPVCEQAAEAGDGDPLEPCERRHETSRSGHATLPVGIERAKVALKRSAMATSCSSTPGSRCPRRSAMVRATRRMR